MVNFAYFGSYFGTPKDFGPCHIKKTFNSPKRQAGEDMLVQNLQPIGEDTISIDPLIFESIGKMS